MKTIKIDDLDYWAIVGVLLDAGLDDLCSRFKSRQTPILVGPDLHREALHKEGIECYGCGRVARCVPRDRDIGYIGIKTCLADSEAKLG